MTERINAAINYMEENMTGQIDPDAIARIACCSRYEFPRMFAALTDMSVAEYIRRRRMTLAGIDLQYHGYTVTEAALKYGYDSPVSFARAFRAFHGINPGKAKRKHAVLNSFPRMIFKFMMQEVAQVIRKDQITIAGKQYEASYFGDFDISSWSVPYSSREFWRIEGADDDFKDKPKTTQVLPYNNYPPINIEIGQVFVVDYHRKDGNATERVYYIADGTVWNDLPSTKKFIPEPVAPVRMERICVGDEEYDAEYYGEQEIGSWSEEYCKREFWRLIGAFDHLKQYERAGNVLPYDNYPPLGVEVGQAFVIDYYRKEDGAVDHREYHLADGTIWHDMLCTRMYLVTE